ncbi:hypothetical protein Ahy_B10g106480 [Arachis hypogaea]|uniref:PB1-like domain-containing protein n=1 Tax=Arachis hypogaea TaxID=3818 RepID=A0A444XB69_ARAHY|nr:hypothetical protein Ahy_B10g106480 [Arachis hypogaea]
MATHITFVYHHRGWLEKDADGVLKYNGGTVSIIDRVHVDTCNLFLVEGLFLDLGYTRYTEVYWLEPGKDLGNGLRVLRRDADVVKLCEAALRNENRVHLYFEHPVDAEPEYVDEAELIGNEEVETLDLVDQQIHQQEAEENEQDEGYENTEVEGDPSENQSNHQADPPQEVEQEQEEDDDPPHQEEEEQEEDETMLNKGGYDSALPDEAATEKVCNETQAGTMENEAPNIGDNHQTHVEDQAGQSNPEEAQGRGRKPRKKHARPQPSGRAQPVPQNNSDAHADDDAGCGVQGRRYHQRPRPSGQKILPPREENQAPRVVVPNPHDQDEEPIEYQPIGRPTKKRARHESESQSGSQYKLKRSYGKTSCKYCRKVGHNSRTCPDKNHVAAGADADAQEAPQSGQPATGGVVPPRGLQDMSDSEQEMYWEETMDAVEEELTQGHPHSEADEEANMNTSGSTSHREGRRATRSNLARRAARSTKAAATTLQTPSNTAAAGAASTSRETIRVKMPIRRTPLAQPNLRPTSTATAAQHHVRPTAPGPQATPRPNPPFRPPQIRPVAPSANAATGSGVPASTMTPLVSNETMNGASKATTSRFSRFMPNQSA